MKSFMKLVHMEVHRFRFVLAGIMGFTAVVQVWALINYVSRKINDMEMRSYTDVSIDYVEKLSFADALFGTQIWFALPCVVGIAGIAIYIFLIWYRDWFGRNTFIYRLLTLPSARRNIYLSKLTAILIFVFALVAFQVALLAFEQILFHLIVPAGRLAHAYFSDAVEANRALAVLLPRNMDSFAISYGLGIMGVVSIFTAILLERSYRKIGIVYAALYLAACVFTLAYPYYAFGPHRSDAYLYPEEFFAVELVLCILIVVLSLWLGFRLLRKKITV